MINIANKPSHLFRRLFIVVLLLNFITGSFAQVTDSAQAIGDTLPATKIESTPASITILKLVSQNTWLNNEVKPLAMPEHLRSEKDASLVFYTLISFIFFLAILKTVFPKYFVTLSQVFFNNSLRQSQLTDQLMQAKLPSLMLNMLFVFSTSFYLSLLFKFYSPGVTSFPWKTFGFCLALLSGMYLVKYLSLKFIGWMTGYSGEADTYTFVLFLINKIIGIVLIPVILLLAFIATEFSYVIILLSFIVIGLLLIMRFLRAYGLLQHKLRVSRFHFLLYIFAVEALPLMLIYKAGMLFVTKNL